MLNYSYKHEGILIGNRKEQEQAHKINNQVKYLILVV